MIPSILSIARGDAAHQTPVQFSASSDHPRLILASRASREAHTLRGSSTTCDKSFTRISDYDGTHVAARCSMESEVARPTPWPNAFKGPMLGGDQSREHVAEMYHAATTRLSSSNIELLYGSYRRSSVANSWVYLMPGLR